MHSASYISHLFFLCCIIYEATLCYTHVDMSLHYLCVARVIMCVCIIINVQVRDEGELTSLSQELERNGVRHKLWVEQPENIATCLATIPSPKSQIAQYFKKYKLFK